jgi:lantibiotic modifying enzyme
MELASALSVLIGLDPVRIPGGEDAVRKAASRLAAQEATGAAGLYLGEGGIALTLARAGRFLDDTEIAAAARQREQHLAAIEPRGDDLFGGRAGALRAQLTLWREDGRDGPPPKAAIAAGETLLAVAEDAGDGMRRWRSAPDPGEARGAVHVGYAHGTAGIADVLLELGEATGDQRFEEAAAAGGRWVLAQALPALADGSGAAWPETEGTEATPPLWCRGATGIGHFMLHLAEAGLVEVAAECAEDAAMTVARGGRFLGPTSCHGLAGSIEFLLDVRAATGDPRWRAEADRLADLLEAFRDDQGTWRSDSGEPLPYDLLTGIAGVARCFQRLSVETP